jgi:radical SAM superfamily enzyme YgiQ (UPF0313 family)
MDAISSPVPGRHLTVPPDFKDQEIWVPFQTRRGCPMKCLYCSTAAIEGRIHRKQSPEYAVKRLEAFVEAGFDRFFFVDNTFNLPVSYANSLCDGIIRAGLKIAWRAILYPWKADEKLIEKMARAGCAEVSLGFESGSDMILPLLNKRFRAADVRKISQILKQFGIRQMGFLLLGGPGETRETVEESLSFAADLNTEAMRITTGIRIYPGTGLAEIALEEGIIRPDDDLLYPKFYLRKNIENFLLERVKEVIKDRPNWIY